MATSREYLDDSSATMRRRFLLAVVSAQPPVRAKDLVVPGLDRRTIQKRLERLRLAAGGPSVDDQQLTAFARREIDRLATPESRGLQVLSGLASPLAREFATGAGLQTTVIDDWVELAHSPGDKGWKRPEVLVTELATSSVFARGNAQSWLKEKKAYLREAWEAARKNRELQRNLMPNLLKMDLVQLTAPGTEDSPLCTIQIAPIDWLSCFALNSRLSEPVLTGGQMWSVRERWGEPALVVERRLLPGMIVAHIVVETGDGRFLVCQRQPRGVQDEPGTWSLSIEERWSGPDYRKGERRPGDGHPHNVVRRGVKEELGVDIVDEDICVVSWGIEASVLYPGFIALAKTSLPSWQIEGLRAHAGDANEIRFVSSVPADLSSVDLLLRDEFAPIGRPGMTHPWHRTSKARLFAALAHSFPDPVDSGRMELLRHLGSAVLTSAKPTTLSK